MMSIKSTLKAASVALFMLVPAYASGQIPADISAFMPSKAEIRQSLVDAGMTPDQVEKALNSMNLPEDTTASMDVPSDAMTPCIDSNENDICDTEESDPVITQCREFYQNELYTTSRGLHGDALGRNSVEVAQTCSMAAAGGSMTHSNEGGWVHDMDQLMEVASYWQAVLSHGRYLSDSDIPEIDDLSEDRLDEIISSLPRDLQTMMKAAGTEELDSIARPIHNKCEGIRSRVRHNYRNNVLVDRICITHVPDTEEASE